MGISWQNQAKIARSDELRTDNARLREAMSKAADILDRNLGIQTEKCYDAIAILRRSLEEK